MKSTPAFLFAVAIMSSPLSHAAGIESPAKIGLPADDAGAKELQHRIEAYVPKSVKGSTSFLDIKPNGNNYLLTINPASVDIPSLFPRESNITFHATPSQWRLKPSSVDKWDITQTGDAALSFDGLSFNTKVSVENINDHEIFDTSLMGSSGKGEIKRIEATSSKLDPKGSVISTTRRTVENVAYTVESTKKDADSINVYFHQTAATSLTSIFTTLPAANVEIKSKNSVEEASIDGLRSRAFYNLWAWIVAHPEKDQIIANQEELRILLKASLPLIDHAEIKAAAENISISAADVKINAAKYNGVINVNPPGKEASFSTALSLNGISYDNLPVALPLWAKQLLPSDYSFGLEISGYALQPAITTLIDHFDLSKPEIIPTDVAAAIPSNVTPSGVITIKPTEFRLKSAVYDISLSGAFLIASPAKPSGTITISAKGLNKVISILDDAAKTDPQVAMAATQIKVANALATHASVDESSWKIDLTPDGRLTINGLDLTTKRGGL